MTPPTISPSGTHAAAGRKHRGCEGRVHASQSYERSWLSV
jgi:hypothetical protein